MSLVVLHFVSIHSRTGYLMLNFWCFWGVWRACDNEYSWRQHSLWLSISQYSPHVCVTFKPLRFTTKTSNHYARLGMSRPAHLASAISFDESFALRRKSWLLLVENETLVSLCIAQVTSCSSWIATMAERCWRPPAVLHALAATVRLRLRLGERPESSRQWWISDGPRLSIFPRLIFSCTNADFCE